jgi:cytoskeletal protein RodZ
LHDPDAPDPPVGEFSTVELGAMLRESRQSLGRELEDVAAELRIRLVYLQAIEEGRLDDLPGIAYATGFLRAYGDLLGLEGEDLVRRFKAAGLAMTQATDLHLPSPVEEGRLPTGSVLLVAALLAVGAYGGWYYMSSQGRDPIENVSALPDQLAELVGIEGGDKKAEDTPGAAATDVVASASAAGEETTAMAEPETASLADGATEATSVTPTDEVPASDATATSEIASVTPPPATPEPEPPKEPATRQDEPAPVAPPAVQRTDAPPAPAPAAIARREAGVDRTAPATPTPTVAPAISPPPPSESAPVSTESPAVETVASAPPQAPAAPPAAPPATAPEQPTVTADRAPAPEPVATAAPEPEVAPINPAPAATRIVAAATHRVVLRANTDTWVEVGAAEAVPVLSRLMRQGETFTVPAQPGMMMATGNAGGIEILVDGKAVPQLGPVGVIRRNVALDAESLLKRVAATP